MSKKILGIEYPTREETVFLLEANNLEIASTYRRVIAYLVDCIITFFVAYVITIKYKLALDFFGSEDSWHVLIAFILFWGWVALPFYHAVFALFFRKTIGCYVSGIDIVSMMNLKRQTFAYAFLRGWGMGSTTIVFFPILIVIGIISSLTEWRKDPLRQTGWDMATRTIVVQEK